MLQGHDIWLDQMEQSTGGQSATVTALFLIGP